MERNRLPPYTELEPYDVHNAIHIHHGSVSSKKWWLGFSCAVLGILLLLYLPVYHQLQTRIGETLPGELVGMHLLEALSIYLSATMLIHIIISLNCFSPSVY